MENKSKLKLTVCLAINAILVVIYFYKFHDIEKFNWNEGLSESLKISSEIAKKSTNSNMISSMPLLDRKPSLKQPILACLYEMDSLSTAFSAIADSTLAGETSQQELQTTHARLQNALLETYTKYLWIMQEEAKLRKEEIEQKIANAEENAISHGLYKKLVIKSKFKDKAIVAEAMRENILRIKEILIGDFNSMFGYRGVQFDRPFPIFQITNHHTPKGGRIEGRLLVGSFSRYDKKDDVKLYINGKEAPLDPYEWRLDIPLPDTAKIHHLELVSVWKDAETGKEQRDTVHFKLK